MSDYDPADFEEFKGRTFVTNSGSRYSIDNNGRVLGRASVEGAEILYIAGFETRNYLSFREGLLDSKENFDALIKDIGERPRAGLHLVVSLTDDFVEKKDRVGFITSRIKSIGFGDEVEEEVEEVLLED